MSPFEDSFEESSASPSGLSRGLSRGRSLILGESGKAKLMIEQRRREEQARKHQNWKMRRADLLVKYFADRVAHAVHDVANKKHCFVVWKEDFLHHGFNQKDTKIRESMSKPN
jgi:hypothetical protein